MTPEQIQRIDNASMFVSVFRDDIAVEDWRRAGAKVDGDRIYLDREMVRELIKTIPSDFTYQVTPCL